MGSWRFFRCWLPLRRGRSSCPAFIVERGCLQVGWGGRLQVLLIFRLFLSSRCCCLYPEVCSLVKIPYILLGIVLKIWPFPCHLPIRLSSSLRASTSRSFFDELNPACTIWVPSWTLPWERCSLASDSPPYLFRCLWWERTYRCGISWLWCLSGPVSCRRILPQP